MRSHVLVLSFALLGVAAGCSSSTQTEPKLASSTGSPTYAQTYPDALQGAAKDFGDDRAQARTLEQGFPQRSADVKGADPALLAAIVDKSDEAGKGSAFAAKSEQQRAVRTFFDDERGPLTARVAGAAQTKVNDAKCPTNVDVGGAVSYALKDGVDKQLEKELRSANDAQLLIERNKAALGASAPAAQKLADDVAVASYLVHVALVEDRNRVQRMLDEKSNIDSTLQRAINDEKAFQQEKGRTDAEKKASDERIAALDKSRQALGGAVVNAEVTTRGIDDQIKQAVSEYDAALKALKDQIQQQPAPQKKTAKR